ncbi:MAG TPA: DUF1697 domain-containing protein [Pyrinomonadaceae bacterium]|jgi:uncharacterized protein (DUF1697 family)
MTKYAAFLRGINVGGRTSIKMERLREVFGALGFANVRTYIQSGNVIFETQETDDKELAAKIESAVESEFFKTNVMVRSFDEIKNAVENNPFAGEEFDEKLFHLVFLSEKLSDEKAELLLSNNSETEKFAVRNREVYCFLRNGVADSLLGKKYIDNKLKTPATARNWRTVNKILEL